MARDAMPGSSARRHHSIGQGSVHHGWPAFRPDGSFIDVAMERQARTVLALAERLGL